MRGLFVLLVLGSSGCLGSAYESVVQSGSIEHYRVFLADYGDDPDPRVRDARNKLRKLLWTRASNVDTLAGYEEFLAECDERCPIRADALAARDAALWRDAGKSNATQKSASRYLLVCNQPCAYRADAEIVIEDRRWAIASSEAAGSSDAPILQFLQIYPDSRHLSPAHEALGKIWVHSGLEGRDPALLRKAALLSAAPVVLQENARHNAGVLEAIEAKAETELRAAITHALTAPILVASIGETLGHIDIENENRAFDEATTLGTADGWWAFLRAFPNGQKIAAARAKHEAARWASVESDRLASVETYLAQCPDGAHRDEARVMLEARFWAIAKAAGTIDSFRAYLQQFPDGKHSVECQAAATSLGMVDLQSRLRAAGLSWLVDPDWSAAAPPAPASGQEPSRVQALDDFEAELLESYAEFAVSKRLRGAFAVARLYERLGRTDVVALAKSVEQGVAAQLDGKGVAPVEWLAIATPLAGKLVESGRVTEASSLLSAACGKVRRTWPCSLVRALRSAGSRLSLLAEVKLPIYWDTVVLDDRRSIVRYQQILDKDIQAVFGDDADFRAAIAAGGRTGYAFDAAAKNLERKYRKRMQAVRRALLKTRVAVGIHWAWKWDGDAFEAVAGRFQSSGRWVKGVQNAAMASPGDRFFSFAKLRGVACGDETQSVDSTDLQCKLRLKLPRSKREVFDKQINQQIRARVTWTGEAKRVAEVMFTEDGQRRETEFAIPGRPRLEFIYPLGRVFHR